MLERLKEITREPIMPASEDKELKQRLGLYQVFLKIYEQHRGLLDEILKLENLGQPFLRGVAPRYVHGFVQGEQSYLITNLRESETQAIAQPQGIWTIGRDRNCAIPIPEKWLSRRHAAIQYIDRQGFYLVDFNSTNGSFVNGEPVVQRLLLKDGDQVRLGSLSFSFFFGNTVRNLPEVPPDVLSQVNPTTPLTAAGVASANEYLPLSDDPEPEPPTAPVEEESPLAVQPEDTSLFLKRQRAAEQARGGLPTTPQLDTQQQGDILDRFLSRRTTDDPW